MFDVPKVLSGLGQNRQGIAWFALIFLCVTGVFSILDAVLMSFWHFCCCWVRNVSRDTEDMPMIHFSIVASYDFDECTSMTNKVWLHCKTCTSGLWMVEQYRGEDYPNQQFRC